MRLDIKVREKHIKNGRRCDPGFCPVALAAREQHGNTLNTVLVGPTYINYINKPGDSDADRVHLMLPNRVRRRVGNYDKGRGMRPFAFSVEVPDAA